jgi:hypothetical protein
LQLKNLKRDPTATSQPSSGMAAAGNPPPAPRMATNTTGMYPITGSTAMGQQYPPNTQVPLPQQQGTTNPQAYNYPSAAGAPRPRMDNPQAPNMPYGSLPASSQQQQQQPVPGGYQAAGMMYYNSLNAPRAGGPQQQQQGYYLDSSNIAGQSHVANRQLVPGQQQSNIGGTYNIYSHQQPQQQPMGGGATHFQATPQQQQQQQQLMMNKTGSVGSQQQPQQMTGGVNKATTPSLNQPLLQDPSASGFHQIPRGVVPPQQSQGNKPYQAGTGGVGVSGVPQQYQQQQQSMATPGLVFSANQNQLYSSTGGPPTQQQLPPLPTQHQQQQQQQPYYPYSQPPPAGGKPVSQTVGGNPLPQNYNPKPDQNISGASNPLASSKMMLFLLNRELIFLLLLFIFL